MITGAPDSSFGDAGTLWSSVPSPDNLRSFDDEKAITHVGGTAIDVHLVGLDEAPAIVASTWAMSAADLTWRSSPSVLFLPADGAPQEAGLSAGTLNQRLAAAEIRAEPVASCPGQGSSVCTLVREAPPVVGPWSYFLRTASRTGVISQLPVEGGSLFDPVSFPPTGNIRIALAGGTAAIVSSEGRRLRITIMPAGGPVLTSTLSFTSRPTHLGIEGPLPGLVRFDVASVRFDGQRLSIALTAHRDDPALGDVSQAVLLRFTVGNTIAADQGFGKAGLWVSPAADYRQFVTAAEVYGDRVAGVDGSRIVVFGVLPDGSDLDAAFGSNGVSTRDMDGRLTSPVATNDRDESIYVFARRETDLRAVGCRVRVRTPFNPVASGTIDPAFGDSGTAVLFLDGASATPAGIVAGNADVFVAVTRGIQGIDCDRVPAVVALSRADGRPERSFGAGGFSLRAPAKEPAVLTANGAAVFAGARFGQNPPSLHFVDSDAGATRHVMPALPTTGPDIRSLVHLGDDSLLIGGRGNPAAVVKLTPSGSLDPTFGLGGLATVPDMFTPGVPFFEVEVMGVRADGRIAVWCLGGQSDLAIGLLEPNGALDPSYSSGSSVPGLHDMLLDRRFSRQMFLQPDGSVIGASWDAEQIGLKRILPDGTTDANFGMADQFVAIGGTFPKGLRVSAPTTMPVRGISLGGLAQMGETLYLIATARLGGDTGGGDGTTFTKPAYNFLVVARWNLDGSPDTGFGNGGLQYGGVSPDLANWAARGVLAESSLSLLAYGSASPIEVRSSTVGGTTSTSTLIRNPQPALFRVVHPSGIDFGFGADGAAIMRMQEFGPARFVAGVVLPNGRLRLACVDTAPTPRSDRPATTFGGLAQFE